MSTCTIQKTRKKIWGRQNNCTLNGSFGVKEEKSVFFAKFLWQSTLVQTVNCCIFSIYLTVISVYLLINLHDHWFAADTQNFEMTDMKMCNILTVYAAFLNAATFFLCVCACRYLYLNPVGWVVGFWLRIPIAARAKLIL